ncbi:MAG TPA: hypothetical protein VHX37_02035 [Acidobacteriaceae bacterium]|jgi:hypothetical protein|nr:hypothetical protein [Acidobacteriaceae bacterium]
MSNQARVPKNVRSNPVGDVSETYRATHLDELGMLSESPRKQPAPAAVPKPSVDHELDDLLWGNRGRCE